MQQFAILIFFFRLHFEWFFKQTSNHPQNLSIICNFCKKKIRKNLPTKSYSTIIAAIIFLQTNCVKLQTNFVKLQFHLF